MAKDKNTTKEEISQQSDIEQATNSAENLQNEQHKEEPEQSSATDSTDTESLQEQLDSLRDKCADLADKNLRMMAEFDNYRRRTNKEKLDLINNAGERIFVDMLPLIDDFERAKQSIEQTDDMAALKEGVELIYNKFICFLEKNNVRTIETDNVDFDTEYHEAITTFPAPTEEQKGKVIDCTQKGYTLGDKVIRYAKVVVGE